MKATRLGGRHDSARRPGLFTLPAPSFGIAIALALAGCTGVSGSDTISCASGGNLAEGTYRSVGAGRLAPAEVEWAGRRWRLNSGATNHEGMAHAVSIGEDGHRIRFELRDSEADKSPKDSRGTRRVELSGSLYGDKRRLPNSEELWGAYSFRHHSWQDPAAMRALTGGVYGQVHMGSRFGGSPALAFRRTRDGNFRITTRGEFDREGSIRYEAPLSFDEVHDLVYRLVLHPTDASLTVWLDGERIVEAADASIGHSNAESYWSLGLYFSGGVAGPVVAEYANHVYPESRSLHARIGQPPCWPRG